MAAGIKLTNLNSRLSGPQEKAVKGGKQAAGFLTGPTRTARNFQQPNPLVSEFLNNNPKQESFYQMFSGPEAQQAQFEIDNRVGFYGNTFDGENNNQAQIFLTKYYANLARTPEDLDDLIKKFVISLLKKAAAKTGNKVDDLLVAQLEKALFDS